MDRQEGYTRSSVTIRITLASVPSTPTFLGEVAAFAQILAHTGMLNKIAEQVRLVVATHPVTTSSSTVGVERDGTALTNCLPAPFPLQRLRPRMSWICICIVARLKPCWPMKTTSKSPTDGTLIPPAERRFAQILAQWVWNLRLELGQQLASTELRTTEFAPACEAEAPSTNEPELAEEPTPAVIYGPPQWARPSFTCGFPGSAFIPQPDGTLRCPADHPLYPQERRPERNGSLRVLYAARIGHCRSCPLRAQCQESNATIKPRRVSAVLWPRSSHASSSPIPTDPPTLLPVAPVLWKDWPRCRIRREWLKVIRRETAVFVFRTMSAPSPVTTATEDVLTRAERAHWRLSWEQRLAHNARPLDAPRLSATLHGLPATFAQAFGFDLLATA